MTYLVALMIHANDYSSASTVYPMIVYALFFTSVEVYSYLCDYKRVYASDVYNLVDATYLVLLWTYIFMFFLNTEKGEELPILFPVINLISWLRGLS